MTTQTYKYCSAEVLHNLVLRAMNTTVQAFEMYATSLPVISKSTKLKLPYGNSFVRIGNVESVGKRTFHAPRLHCPSTPTFSAIDI